jgi:DNA-binding NarL/FixJ family response regulator
MRVRVLIADDQQLVRSGFRMILESEPDIEVVAETANGREAVAETRRLLPDVALLDLRMPVQDGVAATAEIAADDSVPTRVLVVTTFDTDEHVYAALRAGASGFLLKDATPEELAAAVRLVAGGEGLLAPS